MTAVISPCGTYRYWLERGPANAPYVAWVLANPSTADATLDDPTVRKARGFSKLWGYERFVFVNVFAGRSTKPKGLLAMKDPVGPENYFAVGKALDGAGKIVAAWGNAIVPSLRHKIKPIKELLELHKGHGTDVMCLGYTADRQPRHPLMLAYATPLEVYAL